MKTTLKYRLIIHAKTNWSTLNEKILDEVNADMLLSMYLSLWNKYRITYHVILWKGKIKYHWSFSFLSSTNKNVHWQNKRENNTTWPVNYPKPQDISPLWTKRFTRLRNPKQAIRYFSMAICNFLYIDLAKTKGLWPWPRKSLEGKWDCFC